MKFMDETETKQVMDQKELQPETMDGKEAVVEGCVHGSGIWERSRL